MADGPTTTDDVFSPEVLAETIQKATPGQILLYGSGAIKKMPFPAGRANLESVGETINFPSWDAGGELEKLEHDGDALTPQKLSQSKEQAFIEHWGKAYSFSEWCRMASANEDPYAIGTSLILGAVDRTLNRRAQEVALTTVLSVDKYNAGTPRNLDYDLVVEGRMKWGDEDNSIALGLSHSKTKGDLYSAKGTDGRPLLTDPIEGGLSKVVGIPFGFSDILAPSAHTPPKYTTLLCKQNAIGLMLSSFAIEADRDILIPADRIAVHVWFAIILYSVAPGSSKSGVVKLIHN